TRVDLHSVGDSDLQRQGLEGAVLSHDGRALSDLRRDARRSEMGELRRRERCRARPALRELHGPLRLRSQWRARHELSARRQLEEYQIQLWREAEAVRMEQGT